MELRTIEEEDYERLRHFVNHYDVRRFIGIREPMNMKQEEEYIENQLDKDSTIILGICVDGELVGDIALEEKEPQVGEIGILVDPEHHGNGYGAEASELLIKHAFNQLNYHKIMTRVVDTNEKSARVWEKLGFQEEGNLRKHNFLDGEFRDFKIYGLLREEWNQ